MTKPATQAGDEVEDLPGGVFFSAQRSDDPPGSDAGLFYKDGTGSVRRVRFVTNARFVFVPLTADATFAALGEVVFVPEVDPRAWTAARDRAARPVPELLRLSPGAFFTALGTTENPTSHRHGVYRMGKDGMIRRVLKDPTHGLNWSNAIPADRFGHFGQALAVSAD